MRSRELPECMLLPWRWEGSVDVSTRCQVALEFPTTLACYAVDQPELQSLFSHHVAVVQSTIAKLLQ